MPQTARLAGNNSCVFAPYAIRATATGEHGSLFIRGLPEHSSPIHPGSIAPRHLYDRPRKQTQFRDCGTEGTRLGRDR